MNQEQQLSIRWLNLRESCDATARNKTLLTKAMDLIDPQSAPVIADLGSGTGNNVLYLLNHLPCSAKILLIEQHRYLFQECQRRLALQFSGVQHQANQLTIEHRGLSFDLHFICQDMLDWIQGSNHVTLYTASALFDLFTQQELTDVVAHLSRTNTPLYATLNYSGISFLPSDTRDPEYIALFEDHMSRPLDRGNPLGAKVNIAAENAVKIQTGVNLHQAQSNWEIPVENQEFLELNLAFYQAGISAQLAGCANDSETLEQFECWINNKATEIKKRELKLSVHHQDWLVVPRATH